MGEKEREREPKRQKRDLRCWFRGADFCLSAMELVFIRTTGVPGDAFNGPPRTDTDLMRQRGEETGTPRKDPLLTKITHKNTDILLQWTMDIFTRLY